MRARILLLGCLAVLGTWENGANLLKAQAQKEPSTSKGQAIERRLREPISFKLRDVPLQQALKEISLHSGVTILPDLPALQAASVDLDAPVTISIHDIDLKSALNIMLRQFDLAYVVEKNAIKITSAEKGRLVRVVYPIADLVMPIGDYTAFRDREPLKDFNGKTRDEMGKVLVELISNAVARESWDKIGGRGSIHYSSHGFALVVQQTLDAQKDVEELLASLRRVQNLQISAEVRIVTTSAPTAARMLREAQKVGQPIRPESAKYGESDRPMSTLDGNQLLALLESAQSDRATRITQVPRFTIYNGQTWRFDDLFEKLGLRFDMQGVATPDRRAIRLLFDFEYKTKVGNSTFGNTTYVRSLSSTDTFVVPNDRTLVWHVGGVGGTHIFMLATPRATVVEEDTRIILGESPPMPRP